MTTKRAPGGGRKPLTPAEPTVKVAITLLESQVEAMKQSGNGNLSQGIRKAIDTMTAPLYNDDMIHNSATYAAYRHRVVGDYVSDACSAQLEKMREFYEARIKELNHRIAILEGEPVESEYVSITE